MINSTVFHLADVHSLTEFQFFFVKSLIFTIVTNPQLLMNKEIAFFNLKRFHDTLCTSSCGAFPFFTKVNSN